ncbi:hypothetical protein FA95DRAFT_1570336 [Auriscalpium vulgare]|uniref:Uncharacterized protein n=1 Tax=Auriscalpium vulgare TaxID=40419 RepID=A0ACB8S3T1_9AGAM|nr:hypothetical protein FA95DRAFT_1570336 [Auriscalpium vulgare]
MSHHDNGPVSGSYDQSLLASVPDPTRAEKQEGYNVDLLEKGQQRPASPPPGAAKPLLPSSHSQDRIHGVDAGAHTHTKPKTPWYRTRYGLLGLAVAALVVIGAAVGGAVGGTRHHHSSSSSSGASEGQGGGGASTTAGQGVAGGGPASTSTPGNGVEIAVPTPTAGIAVQGVA